MDTSESDEDEEDYEVISEMSDSSHELFPPLSRLRRKGGSDSSTPSSSVEDLPAACLQETSSPSDSLVIVDCESESSTDSEYQLLFDTDDDSDSLVTITASENELDSSSSSEDTSISGSSEEIIQENLVSPIYCQELEEQQACLINEDKDSSSSSFSEESDKESEDDQSSVEEVEEVLVKYDGPYADNVTDKELMEQSEE